MHNHWPMQTQPGGHDLTLKFYGPLQWCASAPARSVFGATHWGNTGSTFGPS
jgi:hypothetical protein